MHNNEFNYTYSATKQQEIENIRKKYLPQQESKFEKLRRLDRRTTSVATVWALFFGILGTLVMGGGMSMVMVAGGIWLIPGTVLGISGMAMAAGAYPVFRKVLKKQREKAAPEILKLTDELI